MKLNDTNLTNLQIHIRAKRQTLYKLYNIIYIEQILLSFFTRTFYTSDLRIAANTPLSSPQKNTYQNAC